MEGFELRKYHIAVEKSMGKLVDTVNKLVEQGYEPVGGIATEDYRVAQAMWLKKKPTVKKKPVSRTSSRS